MKKRIEAEDETHELLNRVLRGLPQRRAPATLESRVLEELERRAAQPWWRRGFVRWPVLARSAFVATCLAIIGFTLLGDPWGLARAPAVNQSVMRATSWTHAAGAAITSAADLAAVLMRVIPPIWFYGFAWLAAMLYAALFGLGATAYRSLYRQSPKG